MLESDLWCSAYGTEVAAFVEEFSSFQGAGHGIAVTNDTQALEAALAACGVGPGDEVIVPASTFVATATAAIAIGATPVLVDVELPSCCINELELFRQGNFSSAGNGRPKHYPSGSLPRAEEAAANMVWLDHRILLGAPEDTLDVAVAIERIQASASAVRLRTGKAVRIAGRLARSALGRRAARTAQLLSG